MLPAVVLLIMIVSSILTTPLITADEDNIIFELNVEKLSYSSASDSWDGKERMECAVSIFCKDQGQEGWRGVIKFPHGVTNSHGQIPTKLTGKCDLASKCWDLTYMNKQGKPVHGVQIEDCKVYKLVMESGEFSMEQEHKVTNYLCGVECRC